ncbi:hypothetical protein [Parasediminibacterium sp. JCM 36343]|uniref:hypothetical protein n=1 Tax=Parasediminibacterium sp. JCM 36343 TaxID=3374279 RepID=UPI0039784A20
MKAIKSKLYSGKASTLAGNNTSYRRDGGRVNSSSLFIHNKSTLIHNESILIHDTSSFHPQ